MESLNWGERSSCGLHKTRAPKLLHHRRLRKNHSQPYKLLDHYLRRPLRRKKHHSLFGKKVSHRSSEKSRYEQDASIRTGSIHLWLRRKTSHARRLWLHVTIQDQLIALRYVAFTCSRNLLPPRLPWPSQTTCTCWCTKSRYRCSPSLVPKCNQSSWGKERIWNYYLIFTHVRIKSHQGSL